MIVTGKVLISFRVEIDAEDISEDAMSLRDSDEILSDEINALLPSGFYTEGNVFVKTHGVANVSSQQQK